MNGAVTNRWTIVGGYAYQDAFITHDTTPKAVRWSRSHIILFIVES
jgi:outer membrane receptor for monomeric catechols